MDPAGAVLHLRMPLGMATAAMSMRLTKLVKRPRLPFLSHVTVDACFSSASISAQAEVLKGVAPLQTSPDGLLQTP